MTPEGKELVNAVLEPYDAFVRTGIQPGQDIRFVKIITDGVPEDSLNALDSQGMMVHAEDELRPGIDRRWGRPLLRIISVWPHDNRNNILMLEDVNARPMRRGATPPSGVAYASDRSPLPTPPSTDSAAMSIYPPGHPSYTNPPNYG